MSVPPRFLAALVLIVVASAGATAADPAPSGPRPNVIVILADDLGWGDLSCQPQDPACPDSTLRTPNIDSLAAEGVRCTEAYATCCVCTPSRVGLLTGRYQQRLGWYEFLEAQVGIPAGETLLSEILRSRGYATAMIGKWHVGFAAGARPLTCSMPRPLPTCSPGRTAGFQSTPVSGSRLSTAMCPAIFGVSNICCDTAPGPRSPSSDSL